MSVAITPNLGLTKPDIGSTGWGAQVNANWDKLDSALNGGVYVPRDDDPAAHDFTLSDLTTDGNYHDLDLSSIVPAGTIAVVLRITIIANEPGRRVRFRKKGHSNNYTAPAVRNQVVGVRMDGIPVVPCDANRVIEYQTTNTTAFTEINITVLGWYYSEAAL